MCRKMFFMDIQMNILLTYLFEEQGSKKKFDIYFFDPMSKIIFDGIFRQEARTTVLTAR